MCACVGSGNRKKGVVCLRGCTLAVRYKTLSFFSLFFFLEFIYPPKQAQRSRNCKKKSNKEEKNNERPYPLPPSPLSPTFFFLFPFYLLLLEHVLCILPPFFFLSSLSFSPFPSPLLAAHLFPSIHTYILFFLATPPPLPPPLHHFIDLPHIYI